MRADVMKVSAGSVRGLATPHPAGHPPAHARLCEVAPAGPHGSGGSSRRLLDELEPAGAVAAARRAITAELVADLRLLDDQLRDTQPAVTTAVKASKTTAAELFGVSSIIAATVIGDISDLHRFASRDAFAAYNGTPPVKIYSGDRVFRLYQPAPVGSTTPYTSRQWLRSVTATVRGPGLRRRQGHRKPPGKAAVRASSGASATPSTPVSVTTPHGTAATRGPGGRPGTTL